MEAAVVLLVDDEAPFVEAMAKRLTKRKLSVLTAPHGRKAVEMLDREPSVNVVILDIKMPGMDGIETLREIKRKHPEVEVIILTGHATVDSATEGIRLGAFDYLMKPCDIEHLVARVGEARAKKASRREKTDRAGVA